MKNIEKKWMLFLIATFVTFFGIGHALLKNTFALNETDSSMKDIDSNAEYSDGYDITLSDSCELNDIVFNDGKINFKKDVFEYNLAVSDIKNLEIDPLLVPSSLECTVYNEFLVDENTFVVTVYNVDEVVNVYKINVIEKLLNSNDLEDQKKDYTYVFIAIIGVLVLINIYRIVKKMRSK